MNFKGTSIINVCTPKFSRAKYCITTFDDQAPGLRLLCALRFFPRLFVAENSIFWQIFRIIKISGVFYPVFCQYRFLGRFLSIRKSNKTEDVQLYILYFLKLYLDIFELSRYPELWRYFFSLISGVLSMKDNDLYSKIIYLRNFHSIFPVP